MEIPDDVLLFSGFTLAHAAWSISDVPAGEFLVPLAITESSGGEREVLRFEAPTQADAIAAGKEHIAAVAGSCELWALVREGVMTTVDGEIDVLTVDAGRSGMATKLSVVQPFRPNRGRDEFAILAGGFVAVDAEAVEEEENSQLMAVVVEGVAYHPKGSLWESWEFRGNNAT
jgi:hypothetical protein